MVDLGYYLGANNGFQLQKPAAFSASQSMRSLRVTARGRAEFVDVPEPEHVSGHVLLRTELLSLCGSDVWMLHHAPDAAYPFPMGTTGHEVVGVVQAADEDSGFSVGQHVLTLAPGHKAMCEYYLAPVEHVLPLPPKVPREYLLQAQQLGTVLYAAQRLPNLVGKNVVVIGQGSAGLWFNFQLRRMGADKVVALDLDDQRLELSKTYGASHAFNNALQRPDSVVERMLWRTVGGRRHRGCRRDRFNQSRH